ncbi:MAG TPA: GntR family transcriptional regulator [Lachnoclostridium sp.]|nr:GntR family transcriptional regulator [Lachnoclostridium sp.]
MLDKFEMKMDAFLPLRDVVFQTLRQAILREDLAPGERLMEIPLANKLGVSRTPLREAIRMLEQEGLVVMIPRRGAQVAGISEKSLRDVLEVRKSLEKLAVELACERMTEEDMKEMNRAEEAFSAAVHEGDALRIAETDEQFHDVIYNSTGNTKLVQLLNNLREQMYRYRLEHIKDEKSRLSLLEEHQRMMAALRSRDVELAKKAAGEHIVNQENNVIRNLREQEDNGAAGTAKSWRRASL